MLNKLIWTTVLSFNNRMSYFSQWYEFLNFSFPRQEHL